MAISLLPSSVRDYMAVHISLNILQFCTLHGNYALILTLCFMSLSVKYRRIPHCYSGDGKIHAPLARFSCHRWCIGLTRFSGTRMSSPTTTLGSFWGEKWEASRRRGCMRRGTFLLPSSLLALVTTPSVNCLTIPFYLQPRRFCIFQVSPWPVVFAGPRPWNNGGSSSKIHWSSEHEKRGKFACASGGLSSCRSRITTWEASHLTSCAAHFALWNRLCVRYLSVKTIWPRKRDENTLGQVRNYLIHNFPSIGTSQILMKK